MGEAKSLEDLMRIRSHNRVLLDSFNGALGTALGLKKRTGEDGPTQTPSVIVFVPMKINPKWLPQGQQLPKKLEGPGDLWCELDVVEGGKAEQEKEVSESTSELAERLRGWDERIWSGSQIAHWIDPAKGTYSVGTLGAFARDRSTNQLGLLTNQHVGLSPGQKLYHPVPWGTHFATTERAIVLAADQTWYGPFVDDPNAWVRVDCAFAQLVQGFDTTDINPEMMGVGSLGETKEISLSDMSIIGQKVIRVGRTTGKRKGTVVAFGYEYVDAPNESRYTDLLIVGEKKKPFSTHGDSGSLIVTDDDNLNPIGLLWGGWQEKLRTGHAQENWTYGIALSRVLDSLDIDLVTAL